MLINQKIDMEIKESQGNQGSAEYYVYNYKNSNYEKIALDSSKEITLSNTIDYSVDNKIKVKVVLKDDSRRSNS